MPPVNLSARPTQVRLEVHLHAEKCSCPPEELKQKEVNQERPHIITYRYRRPLSTSLKPVRRWNSMENETAQALEWFDDKHFPDLPAPMLAGHLRVIRKKCAARGAAEYKENPDLLFLAKLRQHPFKLKFYYDGYTNDELKAIDKKYQEEALKCGHPDVRRRIALVKDNSNITVRDVFYGQALPPLVQRTAPRHVSRSTKPSNMPAPEPATAPSAKRKRAAEDTDTAPARIPKKARISGPAPPHAPRSTKPSHMPVPAPATAPSAKRKRAAEYTDTAPARNPKKARTAGPAPPDSGRAIVPLRIVSKTISRKPAQPPASARMPPPPPPPPPSYPSSRGTAHRGDPRRVAPATPELEFPRVEYVSSWPPPRLAQRLCQTWGMRSAKELPVLAAPMPEWRIYLSETVSTDSTTAVPGSQGPR